MRYSFTHGSFPLRSESRAPKTPPTLRDHLMQHTQPHLQRFSNGRCRRHGASVLPFGLLLLLIALCVAVGIWRWLPSRNALGPEAITYTVERGPFVYDVVERGEVESSSNVEVRCDVKAQKTNGVIILDVMAEGTQVEEGDILVRLDSSGLEQDLVQQQIICNSAEAQMVTSRNTYEAAKIAKLEYMEGTYYQEEQTIQSEIFIAEETLRKAQEYLGYSTRLSARGYVTPQQLEGDRFAVEKSRTELATAKTKLRVLQEYTKPKMMMELESNIKSAEAAWKSDESSYKLEVSREKEFADQIEKCTLRAPQAGQVIHANRSSRRGDSEFICEPGAVVREGQVLIRLPDNAKMQVKAKINESRITSLAVGQSVTVRIDAFGDQKLRGVVTTVNEYPEPTSWFSSQVKEYATFIQILDTEEDLKPGLTAEVTIHVSNVRDAIRVPVQAIHEHGRVTYCVVRTGEDSWEAREVKIANNNDKFVMIDEGVVEGDVVALNPRRLLDYVDLPAIIETVDSGGPPTETAPASDAADAQDAAPAREASSPQPAGSPDVATSSATAAPSETAAVNDQTAVDEAPGSPGQPALSAP